MQQFEPETYEDKGLSDRPGLFGERELLQQFVQKQDQAAFATLMRAHGRLVYGVCRRVLGNLHDAEDAFQATFLILARKAGSIRRTEHLSNWLYKVAHRTSLKARSAATKLRRRERPMEQLPMNSTETKNQWPEVEPWLDQELSKLPEAYRLPIIVCDLEGVTHKEAARQLEMPEGTLSSRLVKAREMLAQRLTRRGIVLPAAALTALMSQNVASAAVPQALFASTAAAVGGTLAGVSAGNSLSANVLFLAKDTLTPVFAAKSIVGAVIALGIFATGAAFVMEVDPKGLDPSATLNIEKEIESLGGKLTHKNNDPRQPVTAISFNPDNRFGDKHVPLLKHFSRLTALSLNSTKITDASFEEISALSHLKSLDCSKTDITGSNFNSLANLDHLHFLKLESTRINNESLKNLKALKFLGSLILRSTNISDEGLKNLSELPIASQIQSLSLVSTGITDAGLERLSAFKQLHHLFIGGSQITDAGAKHLEKLKSLRELELNKTSISNDGLKQVFVALPNLSQLTTPEQQINERGGPTMTRRTAGRLTGIVMVIANLIVFGGIGLYVLRKRRLAA